MTTTTAASYRDRAQAIRAIANDAHVAVTASQDGQVVTVLARFPAGDAGAYGIAEAACLEVLAEFPMTRPGTVWGTDSASVGGAVGLRDGYCRLSKSGVERRLAWQFLGTDPDLVLSVSAARGRIERPQRAAERATGIAKHAAHLRELVAELALLDGADDHVAHLAANLTAAAADLRDALDGRGGCAAELQTDVLSLTARIKALLAHPADCPCDSDRREHARLAVTR